MGNKYQIQGTHNFLNYNKLIKTKYVGVYFETRLSLNSQTSSCLCILNMNAGIKRVHHYTQMQNKVLMIQKTELKSVLNYY